MASQGEFIIGQIKRFVGLPFLLVLGVIGSPRKEVVVGAFEVIEGSFYDTFGDLVCPRIALFPNVLELFFERQHIVRREHSFLFRAPSSSPLLHPYLLSHPFPPPFVTKAPPS